MYSPVQVMPDFLKYLYSRNSDNNSIEYLVNSKGGWEKWLQLELSNRMRIKWYTNALEIHMGDHERCDIGIKLKKTFTGSEYLFIELKCQTSVQSYDDVVKGMKVDIKKLSDNDNDYIQMDYKFVVGFFVVSWLDVPAFSRDWNIGNVVRNAGLGQNQSLADSWNRIICGSQIQPKLCEQPTFQGIMCNDGFGIAAICAQVK